LVSHAQYSLSDFKAAASAFERGLKIEPSNASLKSGLQNARARVVENDEVAERTSPSEGQSAGAGAGLGGMADMLRNMGMAGGAGVQGVGCQIWPV